MIEIKSRNVITAEASLGVCFLWSLFTSCYCFVLICVHNGVVSSCVCCSSRNTVAFFESSQKERPSSPT